jgi:hypothetical protein
MSFNKGILQPLCLKVSVTAILAVKKAKFSDLVLVGYGPKLEIYKNSVLVSSKDIFDSTSSYIHGFQDSLFSDNESLDVIVYGEKNFSIVGVDSSGLISK